MQIFGVTQYSVFWSPRLMQEKNVSNESNICVLSIKPSVDFEGFIQILRMFYFVISKLALNCCPELHLQFHCQIVFFYIVVWVYIGTVLSVEWWQIWMTILLVFLFLQH